MYRCIGRLTVGDTTYEDASVGDSTNQVSPGDAHDLAVKSAVSGALKRCAVNLGTQFGLSLYAGGATHDVIRVLVSDGEATDELPDVTHDDESQPNEGAQQ